MTDDAVYILSMIPSVLFALISTAILLSIFLRRRRRRAYFAQPEQEERPSGTSMSQRRHVTGTSSNDGLPFGGGISEGGSRSDDAPIVAPIYPESVPHRKDLLEDSNVGRPQRPIRSHQRSVPPPAYCGNEPDELSYHPPTSMHHHPPWSHHSGNTYASRLAVAGDTELDIEPLYRASTTTSGCKEKDNSSSSNSHRSSSWHDETTIYAGAPLLLRGEIALQSRQSSASDLELLHTHRTHLAAETGQLTPRSRRDSLDRPRARCSRGVTSTHRATISNPENHFASTCMYSPPHSPKFAALPIAVRRASMPDVIPFAAFCRTTPPSPRANPRLAETGLAPPSPLDALSSDEPSGAKSSSNSDLYSANSGKSSANLSSSTFPAFTSPTDILRGHTSGLDIHRPALQTSGSSSKGVKHADISNAHSQMKDD